MTHSPKASSRAIRSSRQRSASCSDRLSLAEPRALFLQRGAHRGQLLLVEPAHQLADVLHLAPLAFEVGDATGFGQGVDQLLGQLQALEQAVPQRHELFAQLLQLGAFALELGLAVVLVVLQFGLELQVQLAAFGDELAAHEVAFFGFA